jgi:hypothetical protein
MTVGVVIGLEAKLEGDQSSKERLSSLEKTFHFPTSTSLYSLCSRDTAYFKYMIKGTPLTHNVTYFHLISFPF